MPPGSTQQNDISHTGAGLYYNTRKWSKFLFIETKFVIFQL
jgi:hypothetical protein